MTPAQRLTDDGLDTVLGHVLRVGVVLSALVVLNGAVIYLMRHAYEMPM